jgi:acetoin utilization protein AcuB
MKLKNLKVKSVMTAFPYWVDAEANLDAARLLMKEHDVSHLPVKRNNELIGIISDRDIRNIASVWRSSMSDTEEITVGDICVHNLISVDLNEPLARVLRLLATNHVGSVVVTRSDRLAGVFTTMDACRVLAEVLEDFDGVPPDDDAPSIA